MKSTGSADSVAVSASCTRRGPGPRAALETSTTESARLVRPPATTPDGEPDAGDAGHSCKTMASAQERVPAMVTQPHRAACDGGASLMEGAGLMNERRKEKGRSAELRRTPIQHRPADYYAIRFRRSRPPWCDPGLARFDGRRLISEETKACGCAGSYPAIRSQPGPRRRTPATASQLRAPLRRLFRRGRVSSRRLLHRHRNPPS